MVAWLTFLACVVAATVYAVALRPGRYLPDLPLSEDAYYAFSVSRNLANGHGLSVDGIHHTNGFQPLFTILTAPLFWLHGLASLRALLIVQASLWLATAFVLGLIVAESSPYTEARNRRLNTLLVAVLYLGSVFAFRTHLNGLETGFLLLMYVLLWRLYQRRGLETPGRAVVFGALAGLLVLARIDAMFVLIAFALVVLVAERDRLKFAVQRLAIVAGTALLVSSPWWLYNLLAFGSLLPTSGTAQQTWAFFDMSRADDVVESLAQAGNPWVYLGDRFASYWPIAIVPALVLVGIMLWVSRNSARVQEKTRESTRAESFLWAMLAGGLVLSAWYFFSPWAVHFYPRYLSLMMLPCVYAVGRLIVRLAARHPITATAGVTVVALVGVVFIGLYLQPSRNSGSVMWREQLPLVERTVPPGDTVAAGQSGTLGYFRAHVVNLDGKVNADAYAQRNDIPAYLVDQDIHWLCDWPNYVEKYLGKDPNRFGWTEVSHEGTFVCMHRS